jgi:hypothetical protein
MDQSQFFFSLLFSRDVAAQLQCDTKSALHHPLRSKVDEQYPNVEVILMLMSNFIMRRFHACPVYGSLAAATVWKRP